MSDKYALGGLVITAVSGWLDISHDIEAENVPFTLAKNDGVGALQFSVASYKGGVNPEITLEHLRALLTDFALSRELGKGFDFHACGKPHLICGQSHNSGSEFVRVWYCTNGQDVVLVTYVCEKGLQTSELLDCEKMVSDLEFTHRP